MCSSASRTHEAGQRRPHRRPRGAFERKLKFAAAVRAAGLPLTLNVVVHRQNLDGIAEMIDLAQALGARRIEIAHVQYYGWALEQPRRAAAEPRAARRGDAHRRGGARAAEGRAGDRLRRARLLRACGRRRCMDGWGAAVPERHAVRHGRCPATPPRPSPASTSRSVRDASLADIWYRSDAFNALPRHRLDARALPRPATGARSTGAAAAARRSR